ncbi:MAG: hypothetical protein ACRER2_13260, partial [Methylococcales bacterium]
VPSASKQDASVLPATAQNAPVLPWKDTILDGVVFTTRQEPDGKVRIVYAFNRNVQHFSKDTEFSDEFRKLGKAVIQEGLVFEQSEFVKVHNYETGEVLTLAVADLARIEDEKGKRFVWRVLQTAALAHSIVAVGARLGAAAALGRG